MTISKFLMQCNYQISRLTSEPRQEGKEGFHYNVHSHCIHSLQGIILSVIFTKVFYYIFALKGSIFITWSGTFKQIHLSFTLKLHSSIK